MRIACGISGGIDSAVSALMLKKQGLKVCGFFMKTWDELDETGVCTFDHDREDALYVCSKIGIPYREINLVKDYWNDVFCPVLQEYKNGATPNPDVLCNKYIKFKAFCFHDALKDFDFIATGHYARKKMDRNTKKCRLLKSVDNSKDQTFFLSQISQPALQKTIFPLGNFSKLRVTTIGMQEPGLKRIARKRESYGMCFIGNKNFQNFVTEYLEPNPGSFLHIESGQTLGRHSGVHLWTVGQRCPTIIAKHGQQPYYVVSLDSTTQNIFVAPGTDHPALFRQSVKVENLHWIHSDHLSDVSELFCELRYIHGYPLVPCRISKNFYGNCFDVYFQNPLRALKTGQMVVFYLGEECLGGARITAVGPSLFDLTQKNYCLLKKLY